MFTNQKQYTLHKSYNFYNLSFERFIISLKKYANYILHLSLPALSNRLQTLNIIKFETLGNKLCWRFQNLQITYLLFFISHFKYTTISSELWNKCPFPDFPQFNTFESFWQIQISRKLKNENYLWKKSSDARIEPVTSRHSTSALTTDIRMRLILVLSLLIYVFT